MNTHKDKNFVSALINKGIVHREINDKQFSMFCVQNDLRRYFDMVENKTLKDDLKIKLKLSFFNKNLLKEVLTIYDYITSFIINIYSEPMEVTKISEDVQVEAEFVVKEFIGAYNKGIAKEDISLKDFIPSSEMKIQLKGLRNKIKGIKKFNNVNVNNIEEFLDWIRKEGSSNLLIKKFLKKVKSVESSNKVEDYVTVTLDMVRQANQDIKDFGRKYNIRLDDEAEVRCLFNSFNLFLHFVLIYGRVIITQDKRELIYAAAAIHPVEDDYIDSETVSEEIFDIVSKKLRGESVIAPNEKTKNIFNLIDTVYDQYPTEENSRLVDIFVELNFWQYQSLKQKKSCNTEELLRISFMKGGYAFALFGYIVIGKMSSEAFRHFFAMGAIFQLMDDIHDIEEDLENNIHTLCTQSFLNNKNIDEVMKGVMEIQRKYDDIVPLIHDVRYPVLLRRLEQVAVRFDSIKFSCSNNKYFSDNYLQELDKQLPVDISEAINFFSKRRVMGNVDDYLKLLEKLKDTFKSLREEKTI